MKSLLLARPIRTVNRGIFLLIDEKILKPPKVTEVIYVPKLLLSDVWWSSYKYIYDDAFIDYFRDIDSFEKIKKVHSILQEDDLQKSSTIEIKNWSSYTLGSTTGKISKYLNDFLPFNYSVHFSNGSEIEIKELVYIESSRTVKFHSFVTTENEEMFKFPIDVIDTITRIE